MEEPTPSWPLARGSGIVAIFQFQKGIVACCTFRVENATNIVAANRRIKSNRRANRAELIYNPLRGSFPVAVVRPERGGLSSPDSPLTLVSESMDASAPWI